MLTNISLDHKEMDELRQLVRRLPAIGRARRCSTSTIRRPARSPTACLPEKRDRLRVRQPRRGDFMGKDLQLQPNGVTLRASKPKASATTCGLRSPGATMRRTRWRRSPRRARSACRIEDAASALGRFEGLKRRLETVGEAAGVTVIDDFAHNPDKIAATLATLRAQPGRLLIMFQPHGYGPLAKMGEQLADSFADGMAPDDRLYLPDPVYQGGTVDRARGSDWLAEQVGRRGGEAEHIAGARRDRRRAVAEAQAGRPHPDHGRARRHADRFRARSGGAGSAAGTERGLPRRVAHGQTRNRHRLEAAARRARAAAPALPAEIRECRSPIM